MMKVYCPGVPFRWQHQKRQEPQAYRHAARIKRRDFLQTHRTQRRLMQQTEKKGPLSACAQKMNGQHRFAKDSFYEEKRAFLLLLHSRRAFSVQSGKEFQAPDTGIRLSSHRV